MENFRNALLITMLIVGLVYICTAFFREIKFRRAINKKIKEAIEELERMEEEKDEN